MSRSVSPAWADASTFTARLPREDVRPVRRLTLSVAVAAPGVALAELSSKSTPLYDSWKSDASTPAANVDPNSVTVTVRSTRIGQPNCVLISDGEVMAAVGVSSSCTVTGSVARLGRPKKSPAHGCPARLWRMEIVVSTPSASCSAATVTVCGVFQFAPSNSSSFVCGHASGPMAASGVLVAMTTTVQPSPAAVVGSAVSATVYSPTLASVPPPAAGSSSSARLAGFRAMPGVGVTATVPAARSFALPEWADPLTLTASVSTALKSPAKASVSVVEVAPAATLAMETPGMSVASSKLAAVALSKVARSSATVRAAPSRLASVSVAGTVARAAAGPATVTRNMTLAVSPSSSVAVATTTLTMLRRGVPQTVRGAVAQDGPVPGGKSPAAQPPASAPVASNLRPAGSPAMA